MLNALAVFPSRSIPAVRAAAMPPASRKRPAAADSEQPPPRVGRSAMGARIDAAAAADASVPMADMPPVPVPVPVPRPMPVGIPLPPVGIQLPRVPIAPPPTVVQIPSLAKDRICAIYTQPIQISEYVKEEWVILMAAHYPPASKRYDVLALTGMVLICLDPFECFPDEIDKLPPCPPW